MSTLIHEKISRQLEVHKKRRRELAEHLGIAPQTMTDICKGRSAVTLHHLRGLVTFFGLRPDFWLEEERADPAPLDHVDLFADEDLRRLEAVLLTDGPPRRSAAQLLAGAMNLRRDAWQARLQIPMAPFVERLRQAAHPEAPLGHDTAAAQSPG